MFQIDLPGLNATVNIANPQMKINIGDKLTTLDPASLYRPLVTITSQFTGKSKTFITSVDSWEYIERYVNLGFYTVREGIVPEDLGAGVVALGTTSFPLGFYDIIVYQNTSNTNLDPTGLPVVWRGLMNLKLRTDLNGSDVNDTPVPVKYTQYTNNDADTNSIYITN
tara:strand:- start:884 stop:1384 length:501 start_codon:yes stop_codon:yes gene_type:complete